jgi:hypothetical protein
MAQRAANKLDADRNFNAHCSLLKQNDPETTVLGEYLPDPCSTACLRRLGEAVQGNTQVTSCIIDLEAIESSAMDALEDYVSLLVDFLQRSETLRDVYLTVNEDSADPNRIPKRLVGLIVHALSNNGCIVVFRAIALDCIPIDAFTKLLHTNQLLKSMDVDLGSFEEVDPQLVEKAFLAAKNLESLELNGLRTDDGLYIAVLRALQTLPKLECFMCWLNCDLGVEVIVALATFLTTTHSLKHLKLHSQDLFFKKNEVESLVAGLHANTSMTKLSFDIAGFATDATNVLVRFMQLNRTAISHNIQELVFTSPPEFQDSKAGEVVGRMLIGSFLKILRIEYCEYCPWYMKVMFSTLTANAPLIRLQQLHIDAVEDGAWEALFTCLPLLVTLKVLKIPEPSNRRGSLVPSLLQAIRQNGSLHFVNFSSEEGHKVLFDIQLRRLCAYTKRNKLLVSMLWDLRGDGQMDNCKKRSGKRRNQTACARKICLSLLPVLFEVARQCRRMNPNITFAGLLMASSSIGGATDGKRVVPTRHVTVVERRFK